MRALGDSPLSRVFLVENEEGRAFALKILRASVARDPRLRARWEREAALLQELRHPQLVRGYGAAEVEGCPAMLLEFIDGPTLRAAIAEQPLGWEQVCRIGIQIARALERLHRAGAVHRDVKPHNILLHPQRGAVLADLGLVRREEDSTLTRQGAALGSPAYMSPEQARDPSAVGPQADLYSLGATLHHALNGAPPFRGRGVGEVIHRVLHEAPEPLPEEVPEALRKVIETAMAKDPERRYANARDLGQDLGRVLLGYAPRLRTRDGLRRRRQRWLLATATPLALALLWWWQPWRLLSPSAVDPKADGSQTVTLAPPPTDAASQRAPSTAPPTAPADPTAAFLRWSRATRLQVDQALSAHALRQASQQLDELEAAAIPPAAPVGFLQARRDYLLDQRRELEVTAERLGGQAIDLLDKRLDLARAAMRRGPFQVEPWEQEVRQAWRQAQLPVEDLPLRAGGVDPLGRLRLAVASLQAEAEAASLDRALERVPALISAARQDLRQGRFAAARRRWEGLDPKALFQSSDGRAELVRIDELLALDRRLEARLREHVGQDMSLTLASGAVLSGTLLPEAGGYQLDYFGQARIPVRLLDLEPKAAVTWLTGHEEPWLVAQLYWCQGKLSAAIEHMRLVQPTTVPEEWQPHRWLWEWQQAFDAAAASAPTANHGEGPGAAPTAAAEAAPVAAPLAVDPRQFLEETIRRQHPQVHSRRLADGSLEVSWQGLKIDRSWVLDLRGEGHFDALLEWSMTWNLPPAATPPRRLSWMGDIRLDHPGGRLLPSMQVSGRAAEGFGMQAGSPQELAWDGREVLLDQLMVAPWQPSTRARERFELSTSSALTLDRLTLRLRPR